MQILGLPWTCQVSFYLGLGFSRPMSTHTHWIKNVGCTLLGQLLAQSASGSHEASQSLSGTMLITEHIHSSTVPGRAQPQVCSWDSDPSPCSQGCLEFLQLDKRVIPKWGSCSTISMNGPLGDPGAPFRPGWGTLPRWLLLPSGPRSMQVPTPSARRECFPPSKTAFAQWGWKKGCKMEKVIQGDFLLTSKVRFPAKISNFFRLEVRAWENQEILRSEGITDKAEEAILRKGSMGISLEGFSGELGFRLAECHVKRTEVS